MITVYKQTRHGDQVVGSMDENQRTYRGEYPNHWELHWSMDEAGQVYLEHEGLRALIGWIEESGAVYAQAGRAASGSFSFPESSRLFQARKTFTPDITFQVMTDDRVYRPQKRGVKMVGRVEGTSDVRMIGALALVLLSWEN